jgi:hypothetical protein
MLQKEVEIVKYNSNGQSQSLNNTRRGKQEFDSELWPGDVKSPKRSKNLIRTLQAENQELINERK